MLGWESTSLNSRSLPPGAPNMDSSTDQALPLQASTGSGRSKKKVTSACLECRRARSKCSASRPCARCQTLSIECIFNEGGDLRRRETRERRANQLAQQQQMLEDLLQFLRQRSLVRVRELISVVKHTDSNTDIHEWLREKNDEDPLMTVESTTEPLESIESLSASSSWARDTSSAPTRRQMLSLNELTESRDETTS